MQLGGAIFFLTQDFWIFGCGTLVPSRLALYHLGLAPPGPKHRSGGESPGRELGQRLQLRGVF